MTGPSGTADCATEKVKRPPLAVEISRDELACRIAEAVIRIERPSGISARAVLALIEACQPGYAARWLAAADAAAEFFCERVNVATSQDSTNG